MISASFMMSSVMRAIRWYRYSEHTSARLHSSLFFRTGASPCNVSSWRAIVGCEDCPETFAISRQEPGSAPGFRRKHERLAIKPI
jgi:hypothetical protein